MTEESLPGLSPDELATARRLYREWLRLIHRLDLNKAQVQMFADALDDKYDLTEKGLALQLETARIVRKPGSEVPPAKPPTSSRAAPPGYNPRRPHKGKRP